MRNNESFWKDGYFGGRTVFSVVTEIIFFPLSTIIRCVWIYFYIGGWKNRTNKWI